MQDGSVLEFRGTITVSDVLRFQYFHWFRTTWWFVALVYLFLVGIVVVAATAAVVLLFLVWTAPLVVLPYMAAKKHLRTCVELREPIAYTFSEQSIHFTSAHSSSDISWKALYRVRETKSMFCLYFGASSAWLLPKRFFKDANEQNSWRQLVEQQILPATIARPGFIIGRL